MAASAYRGTQRNVSEADVPHSAGIHPSLWQSRKERQTIDSEYPVLYGSQAILSLVDEISARVLWLASGPARHACTVSNAS